MMVVTLPARGQRRGDRGFSLLEIVLVVSLIGILTLLALPSYQGVMLKAHRTEAIAQLMQAVACQERTRAGRGAYDIRLCLPAASRHYRFSYSKTDSMAFYRVEAHPLGVQARDPCGSISLDATGRRFVSAPDATASLCWAGR